jgi:hypothetical protein
VGPPADQGQHRAAGSGGAPAWLPPRQSLQSLAGRTGATSPAAGPLRSRARGAGPAPPVLAELPTPDRCRRSATNRPDPVHDTAGEPSHRPAGRRSGRLAGDRGSPERALLLWPPVPRRADSTASMLHILRSERPDQEAAEHGVLCGQVDARDVQLRRGSQPSRRPGGCPVGIDDKNRSVGRDQPARTASLRRQPPRVVIPEVPLSSGSGHHPQPKEAPRSDSKVSQQGPATMWNRLRQMIFVGSRQRLPRWPAVPWIGGPAHALALRPAFVVDGNRLTSARILGAPDGHR